MPHIAVTTAKHKPKHADRISGGLAEAMLPCMLLSIVHELLVAKLHELLTEKLHELLTAKPHDLTIAKLPKPHIAKLHEALQSLDVALLQAMLGKTKQR